VVEKEVGCSWRCGVVQKSDQAAGLHRPLMARVGSIWGEGNGGGFDTRALHGRKWKEMRGVWSVRHTHERGSRPAAAQA
jgi:hypothetical protein